ncbi:hypothetical protein JHK87_004301 [Glycine soja]|nr:hypothetical protein JHK87_004301 [Glycine soja]
MKASFNSTFVFNIHPITSPSGEGFSFILASNTSLPSSSAGQWLGNVNSTSIRVSNIVVVEFDTRKNYDEDIDDNHAGLDVKSIYSIQQQPLGPHSVNLSSGIDVVATVYFDAKDGKMSIFVSTSDLRLKKPLLVVDLDLSKLLPKDVFVGFSASTGELVSATRNFHSSNKLGKEGFCMVYKSTLNGKDVAAKRILRNSRHSKQDFMVEITTIWNLNHKNLVKLIRWCYEKGEIILVYELMQNGSLYKFIFSTFGGDSILSWEMRLSVICGVSTGLDYLHNRCDKRVLHRDIKPSNVMLDSDFNAQLGDFGLARTIHLSEKTHHSTREIVGTPGYMALESFYTRRALVETDVYAFGVLMLEVVCSGRRKPEYKLDLRCCNDIVDWVWEHHFKENITGVVDSRLNGDFDEA